MCFHLYTSTGSTTEAACATAGAAIAAATWHLHRLDTDDAHRMTLHRLPRHLGDSIPSGKILQVTSVTTTTGAPLLHSMISQGVSQSGLPSAVFSPLSSEVSQQAPHVSSTAKPVDEKLRIVEENGFLQHPRTFLSDYAGGDSRAMSLSDALDRCNELGSPACGGVSSLLVYFSGNPLRGF